MTLGEMQKRVDKAFSNMRFDKVAIVHCETKEIKPVVTVQIVAGGFENMRILTRCRVMDDFLSQKDPEIVKQFLFVFECYTPLEYRHVIVRPFDRH